MIDIESMVVDTVYNAVKTAYPKCDVTSEYNDTPSQFPCVQIVEADNYTYRKTQDNDLTEHHATVMYEINIFSNLKTGKKAEAKGISDVVDSTMQSMKFTRILKQPIPNKDKTIYRIVARYEAVVGEGFELGKNTVYQMYRK